VLALLDSIPHGIIEATLVLTYQFDRATIAGLVQEGLATAEREILAGSDRTMIEVVRIRITDGGGGRLKADQAHPAVKLTRLSPDWPWYCLSESPPGREECSGGVGSNKRMITPLSERIMPLGFTP
jgi:hypothetical protein